MFGLSITQLEIKSTLWLRRFYQPSRRRQSHLRHENLGVLLPDLWAPVGAINIILTLTTAIRNTIAIIIMSKLYHSRSIPHLSKI